MSCKKEALVHHGLLEAGSPGGKGSSAYHSEQQILETLTVIDKIEVHL